MQVPGVARKLTSDFGRHTVRTYLRSEHPHDRRAHGLRDSRFNPIDEIRRGSTSTQRQRRNITKLCSEDATHKVLISHRGKSTENLFHDVVEFSSRLIPHNQRITRDQIRLEEDEERDLRRVKVGYAVKIAGELKEEIKRDNIPNIKASYTKTTVENFTSAVNQVSAKLGFNLTNVDDEVITLAAYYCLKTDAAKKENRLEGFFDKMPTGLLDPTNDEYLSRVRILFKHYLLDLRDDINFASDIENFENWDRGGIKEAKLDGIKNYISLIDTLYLLFPAHFIGKDPAIRQWLIKYPNKWHGQEGLNLAVRALKWMFREEGFINSNGTYDLEKLRAVKSWNDLFRKHGLHGMLTCNENINGVMDAINLAAPNLIGLEENQLHPWEVTHDNMWIQKDTNGSLLIDYVTEYLVEKKLKCIYEDWPHKGKVDVKKVMAVEDWAKKFNEVAPACLQQSGMTALEAIYRKYKDAIGYGEHQLKPWEVAFNGMWDEERGKRLFRVAFAYSLAKSEKSGTPESGLGTSYLDEIPPSFTFTRKEFEDWYKENFEDKGRQFKDHFADSGLGYPFRKVASNHAREALKILFGDDKANSINAEYAKTFVVSYLGPNDCVIITFDLPETLISKNPNLKDSQSACVRENIGEHDRTRELKERLSARVTHPFEGDLIVLNHKQFPAPLTLDSLKRFDMTRTNLEKDLRHDTNGFLLSKMSDLVVTCSSLGKGATKLSPLEQILKTRVPMSKTYEFSDAEITELLGLTRTLLDDVNFNSLLYLKEKLKSYIDELLELKGNTRDRVARIVRAAGVNGQSVNGSDELTKTEILNNVISHVACAVILHAIEAKAKGDKSFSGGYNFQIMKEAVFPIDAERENDALKIADRIRVLRRKATGLLDECERGDINKTLAEIDFTSDSNLKPLDVLQKIENHVNATETGMELLSSSTNYERFTGEIRENAKRLSVRYTPGDIELESMIAWHLRKKYVAKQAGRVTYRGQRITSECHGFLDDFPEGFLNPTSSDFLPRLCTLGAYALSA